MTDGNLISTATGYKYKRLNNSNRQNRVNAREVLLSLFVCDRMTSNLELAQKLAESIQLPAPTRKSEATKFIVKHYKKEKRWAAKKDSPTPAARAALKDNFYRSNDWRALRYKALRNCGAACQCCGAKSGDGVQIHVDHIKPRSKYPELALDLENLQILCDDCNMGKSNIFVDDWRELN